MSLWASSCFCMHLCRKCWIVTHRIPGVLHLCEYWPLIGRERSSDLDPVPSLVKSWTLCGASLRITELCNSHKNVHPSTGNNEVFQQYFLSILVASHFHKYFNEWEEFFHRTKIWKWWQIFSVRSTLSMVPNMKSKYKEGWHRNYQMSQDKLFVRQAYPRPPVIDQ